MWAGVPKRIRDFAFCVRRHESHHNYRAKNPRSSADGAYQFISATWIGNAAHTKWRGQYVARQYRAAGDAPKWIQDLVFIHSIKNDGWLNWKGTNCGHGT